MKSQVQRELLIKVINFIEKIKGQLQEVGLSKEEIATYFATRIFKTQDQLKRQSDGQIVIKKQLQIWLGAKKQAQVSIKTVLVQLLICLEIDYEQINQYENYQPEKFVQMKIPKKYPQNLSLEMPALKKKEVKHFWEKLRQDQSVIKESPIRNPTPQSALLQDFQKELNESLMKTKQLKQLIQQKISDQLYDPYASCTRHIHNMLALQSN